MLITTNHEVKASLTTKNKPAVQLVIKPSPPFWEYMQLTWEKNGCLLLAGLVDPSPTFFAHSSHRRSHPWMCQTNSSLSTSNLHQRTEWAPVMRRKHDTYWHLKSWVILTLLQATEGPHSTLLCPRKEVGNF